jgi:NAD(P)H-dependent FMN reductase
MYLIISGTNRKDSVSIKIARQYADILRGYGENAEVLNLQDLPKDYIYSALYENVGKNTDFNRFRSAMNAAVKLIFIIPEYNGSFPGVLKVFIDGLDRVQALTDKKSALVGISSGDQGAGLALSHFTDILNYCGNHVLGYRLRIPNISDHMTDNVITDSQYLAKLHKQIQKLISF